MGFNDDNYGMDIITQFKGINTLSGQLNFVLLQLYSLDGETQEAFRSDLIRLEKLFTDLDFMRQVRERDGLVEMHPVEYFGRDYGDNDPYLFNMPLEKKINDLSLELFGILGRVINMMKHKKVFIGDEA